MSSSSCASKNCQYNTVQLHKAKYIWTIDNFSSFEKIKGKKGFITSPTFSALTDSSYKWNLLCMPCGKSTGTPNDLGLFLRLKKVSENKKACAEFSLDILNEKLEIVPFRSREYTGYVFDNTIKKKQSDDDEDENECADWGWFSFLQKDNFFKNTLLVDDKLIISCNLTFFEINESNMKAFFHRCNTVSSQHLANDLTSMIQNPSFTDVVLSVQGKDYPAHKFMLSGRSKVFAAMFNHNTKESKENHVEIKDMNEEIMDEMLRFIYSGNCENVGKLAEGLLAAAEKYDLSDLKRICEESLYKDLTVENAPSILVLADTYRANELKANVINLIVAESSKVVNTASWNSIMPLYPSLLNEVCIAFSRRGSTT